MRSFGRELSCQFDNAARTYYCHVCRLIAKDECDVMWVMTLLDSTGTRKLVTTSFIHFCRTDLLGERVIINQDVSAF